MRKIFVLSFVGLLLFSVMGHTESSGASKDRSQPQGITGVSQSGKLFTVTLTPNDKVIRIDLAGIPAAKFDLVNKEVEVLIVEGKNKRPVKVMKQQEGYFVTETLGQTQKLDLEIKAKHKADSETFRFTMP